MGRGPHPRDADLFGPEALGALCEAVSDLSWLLERGYAEPSALELVGNRHALRQRQRTASSRCAASDRAVRARRERRLEARDVEGRALSVDALNCVIVVESILSGGVVLRGRDGVLRDMASVHGSYRRVAATERALELLVGVLAEARPSRVHWLVDRPVSNSGRLAEQIRDLDPGLEGMAWAVDTPMDADPVLLASSDVVASGDANVLDRCGPWVDLPDSVLDRVDDAWLVDLSE